MYKILITTSYYTGGSSSIHTAVLEFDEAPSAIIAFNAINDNQRTKEGRASTYSQTALKLF